jgi:hypothetical protein
MKPTQLAFAFFLVAGLVCVAIAGDITVRTTGRAGNQSVAVNTNKTCLSALNWDGVGGGGSYELGVQLVNGMVVVTERQSVFDKGIGSESVNTTRISTNRLPYTFTTTAWQSTVTVSRAAMPKSESTAGRR